MSDQPLLPDDQARTEDDDNDAPQSDDVTIDGEAQESEPSDLLDEDASIEEEETSTADFEMWGAADRKGPQDQRFGTENAFNEAVNQVVNGINIINHYAASAPGATKNNSAPVRAEQISRNHRVYVEAPPIDARARSFLATKHLVILAGEQHMGKQTAGLNLLLDRSVEGQLFAISPNVDFDDDQALIIEPQHGYLIGSLLPASLDKLDGFALQRLTSSLDASDSYLVITVNGRAALDRDAIAEYVIHWNVPPQTEQVLEKHLAKMPLANPRSAGRC